MCGEIAKGKGRESEVANMFKFVEESNLRRALSQFSPYKSPGPDNLWPICLQKLPRSMRDRLCSLYKASLFLEWTPSCWRSAEVIFIPKDRPDIKGPRDLRPITISSFVLKGLERLLL